MLVTQEDLTAIASFRLTGENIAPKIDTFRLSGNLAFRSSEWEIYLRKRNGVPDLISPFSSSNHMVYMGNFFTSSPLVEQLAEENIFVAVLKYIKQKI